MGRTGIQGMQHSSNSQASNSIHPQPALSRQRYPTLPSYALTMTASNPPPHINPSYNSLGQPTCHPLSQATHPKPAKQPWLPCPLLRKPLPNANQYYSSAMAPKASPCDPNGGQQSPFASPCRPVAHRAPLQACRSAALQHPPPHHSGCARLLPTSDSCQVQLLGGCFCCLRFGNCGIEVLLSLVAHV
jgi:hypothetical protein